MHITTTKSKNAESFYITQTFKKKNGSSSSKHIKKLGTLAELSQKLKQKNIKKRKKQKQPLFLSIPTVSWITTSRNFMPEAIFSCSRFTTNWDYIRCAGRSGQSTITSMI